MDFETGQKVRYKPNLLAGGLRRDQVGIVRKVFNLPANGRRADIEFEDGTVDPGVLITQIEHVPDDDEA